MGEPMHLVDTTLFYSPTSGGVKRYLTAKHAWLAAHSSWEHTIVVPGREEQMQRGGLCTLAGYPVPATFNYRLPLNPRRWTRLLDALEPTLLEAGDAFHPAWCAWRVAQRRGIPVVGFYHSNVPQIIGRRVGRSEEHTSELQSLAYLVCRLLLEKKKKKKKNKKYDKKKQKKKKKKKKKRKK